MEAYPIYLDLRELSLLNIIYLNMVDKKKKILKAPCRKWRVAYDHRPLEFLTGRQRWRAHMERETETARETQPFPASGIAIPGTTTWIVIE